MIPVNYYFTHVVVKFWTYCNDQVKNLLRSISVGFKYTFFIRKKCEPLFLC